MDHIPWGHGMINRIDESDRNFGVHIETNSPIVTHMRTFRHRIDLARSTQTTRPISDYFYEVLSTLTPDSFASDIACKKGCSYCCNTWVYATAPEIFHLASSLNTENSQAFTMPIKAAADVRQKIPAEARSAHLSPCPILKDGECSQYDARPAACRTAYSLDATACQRALLDPMESMIPIPEFSVVLRAAYAIALDGALLNAGYSLIRYELRTALDIALSLPDAEKDWLLGQEIFGSSLRDVEDHFLASPIKRALYEAAFP